MDSNIGKRGQHVSRMKWRNVTTKLVVESSIKERKLVLRIEVGKDLEDVCELEEKTDQYSLFVLLFFFFLLHVGRGLCNGLGENFNCFR